MKLAHITMIAVLAASLSIPAFAQPMQGSGQGMGPGAGMGQGSGMGPGAGNGGGRGGRFAWDSNNTMGWTLMTAEERVAHQTRMREVKTYDECKAVQDENHQAMLARAKEKGLTLAAPRGNGCDVMKARGFFK